MNVAIAKSCWINSQSCINWLLFLRTYILQTFGNTAHLPFVFTWRPIASLNLIQCYLVPYILLKLSKDKIYLKISLMVYNCFSYFLHKCLNIIFCQIKYFWGGDTIRHFETIEFLWNTSWIKYDSTYHRKRTCFVRKTPHAMPDLLTSLH